MRYKSELQLIGRSLGQEPFKYTAQTIATEEQKLYGDILRTHRTFISGEILTFLAYSLGIEDCDILQYLEVRIYTVHRRRKNTQEQAKSSLNATLAI